MLLGVRELARRMGEVAAPHKFVIADAVAVLDTDRIVQEAPIITILQVFTRFALQFVKSPVVVDHADVAPVVIVDLP